jgi:putative ABC transport system permease protein
MFLTDIVRYAVGSMGRRKFRTALTTLGVAIGITAIVALLSITQGLQASVQNELRDGLGTDILTVAASSGSQLLINDTTGIESLEHVSLAVPLIVRDGYLQSDDALVGVSVIGTDMDRFRIAYSSVFVPRSGSIPSHPMNEVVVLGSRVSDPGLNGTVLFPVNSKVDLLKPGAIGSGGSNLSYGGTVAGVLNTIGPVSIGEMSDTSVYIPIEQASSFYRTYQCTMILVKLSDDKQSTVDEVTAALEERFDGNIEVSSSMVVNTVVSRVFSTLDLFLIGVAGITLLIAGVGIMNTMTISLIERTKEIGILKSLGLKNRTVLSIFLCEAGMVGLIGGIAGAVLGYLLASVIASFLNGDTFHAWSGISVYADITIVPELSPMVVSVAIAFGLAISVLFSLYPAWRASRLSPVEALRHE